MKNFVLVLTMAGCSDAKSNSFAGGAGSDLSSVSQCTGALADYCTQGTGCADYGQEVSMLRSATCFHTRFGTCAAFRFIENESGGLGEFELKYYDPSGKLIFVHHETDVNRYCGNTSYIIEYGSQPVCDRVLTETLCIDTNRLNSADCSACDANQLCVEHLSSSGGNQGAECVRVDPSCQPGTCGAPCNSAVCGTSANSQCQHQPTYGSELADAFHCYAM